MIALVASITALLLSTLILMVGSGLLGTLLSVRMAAEAFPANVTGAVMAAYFAGLMLGALTAGAVIRRAGHVRAFAVFAAVITAAALVHGLYVHAWIWAGLRIVTGFSVAGLYMVIESWLNERASAGSRGRLFSFYQIASYLGLGSGQFLLPLRPVEGTELFMITAAILALCLVPVSLTRAIHPTPPQRHRLALRAVFGSSRLGVLLCAAAGIVNGAGFALAPVFVVTSAGVQSVSVFMGAMVLGGMLLQYPIGQLSDRFDRRLLIVGVNIALLAVSGLLLAVAGQALPVLAAVAALYGGLSFTLYPLAVAHINDRIGAREDVDFVGVASALLFLWGVGAALGPVAVGTVMAQAGPQGLFLAVAGVAGLVALCALAARGEAVPATEQTAFVSMARTTAVISELDPRMRVIDPQLDWIEELARAEAQARDAAAHAAGEPREAA